MKEETLKDLIYILRKEGHWLKGVLVCKGEWSSTREKIVCYRIFFSQEFLDGASYVYDYSTSNLLGYPVPSGNFFIELPTNTYVKVFEGEE